MSYSCLDNDDVMILETTNLCLEQENTDLQDISIDGIDIVNQFLQSFDFFRGNTFQGSSSGYWFPNIDSNYLNQALYTSYDADGYSSAPLLISIFFQSYYNTVMENINLFKSLSTLLYDIVKNLCYQMETDYYEYISDIPGVETRISQNSVASMTIYVSDVNLVKALYDSLQAQGLPLLYRGPEELDYGGDNPISIVDDLPWVTSVDTTNDTITIDTITTVNVGETVLFQFPELINSESYVDLMKTELDKLTYYFEHGNNIPEYIFNTIITVDENFDGDRKFYLTRDGSTYEAPADTIVQGLTYRLDQSDRSNTGNRLGFQDVDTGDEYTDGVTFVGIPGKAGSYTDFTVPTDSPSTLRYYNPDLPDLVMGNILTILSKTY